MSESRHAPSKRKRDAELQEKVEQLQKMFGYDAELLRDMLEANNHDITKTMNQLEDMEGTGEPQGLEREDTVPMFHTDQDSLREREADFRFWTGRATSVHVRDAGISCILHPLHIDVTSMPPPPPPPPPPP